MMTDLLTLKELDIFGVLIAPMALYIVIGIVLFFALRALLTRLRIDRFIWHPSLFDMALCVSLVALVTIFATRSIG